MSKDLNIYHLLKADKIVEAKRVCHELIELGEAEDNIHEIIRGKVYLAIVYTHLRKYEKSKEIFDKFFDKIIDELGKKWNGKELVQTYLAYDRVDKPLEYLHAYLTFNPQNSEALFQKANVLIKQGDYNESIVLLKRVLKKHPQHAGIVYSLALSYQMQGEIQLSFNTYEEALDFGKSEVLPTIFGFLFERQGVCEYSQCSECCCVNQSLVGTDGFQISNRPEMNRLLLQDSRNNCWLKHGEKEDGSWFFKCQNLQENNACSDYQNRPQICQDYPLSIIDLRAACSYTFILKAELPRFKSPKVLAIVLDILEAGKYREARENILRINGDLFIK